MLAVGTLLYGYCNGFFSRDSYDIKRIEAFGADWIVARSIERADQAQPEFATFLSSEQMIKYVAEWSSAQAKFEYEDRY